MTRLALAAALLLAATPAFAQNWTESQVGSYRYYNSDNGWHGTGNQVGSYYYQQFTGPNGQSKHCTSSQVGSYTYTNCN
jgi:hypothetical protein